MQTLVYNTVGRGRACGGRKCRELVKTNEVNGASWNFFGTFAKNNSTLVGMLSWADFSLELPGNAWTIFEHQANNEAVQSVATCI